MDALLKRFIESMNSPKKYGTAPRVRVSLTYSFPVMQFSKYPVCRRKAAFSSSNR
jgi:hexokinase